VQSTTGDLSRGRQFWVYGRAGRECRRCRTPIRQAMLGDAGQERATYWCPSCQP
jgi:endonuclease-8